MIPPKADDHHKVSKKKNRSKKNWQKNHGPTAGSIRNAPFKQERNQKSPDSSSEASQLPIHNSRDEIIQQISSSQTLILTGETGSGKTTQIPQFLYNAGYAKKGMIGITQPRRVAAMSIAQRVANEMKTTLGQKVGYAIRFEDVSSPQTRIKYMTDGMLLRELLSDPLLRKYSVLILDEAHERTLRTDILFGAIKSILPQRPELRVIVMSATLNANAFSNFFNNAPIIHAKGRQYPVTVLYAPEILDDYIDASLTSILQIHQNEPPGDILVFLTGQDEIENLEKLITEKAKSLPAETDKLLICPIFASLPTSQQRRVFEPTPSGTRKIILSTNIAETSITINGIKYVVDTGMVKVRERNAKSGIESLKIRPISKASANQRKGRAGREAPGKCYRLFPEASFRALPEETEPEIKRCHLSNVLLLLKASGIEDLTSFEFIDRPSRESLVSSLEELYALGALDESGALSSLGKQMASFPLDPVYSKILSQSQKLGCVREVIGIIAMLSVDPVFFFPHDKRDEAAQSRNRFAHFEGDHLTLYNVMREYEAEKGDSEWCKSHFVNERSMKQIMNIRNQLLALCNQMGMLDGEKLESSPNPQVDADSVLRCLLTGLFRNVAVLQHDGSYRSLVHRQQAFIHPSSVLFQKRPAMIMFSEWVQTTRPYLRHVSSIQPLWMSDLLPLRN